MRATVAMWLEQYLVQPHTSLFPSMYTMKSFTHEKEWLGEDNLLILDKHFPLHKAVIGSL